MSAFVGTGVFPLPFLPSSSAQRKPPHSRSRRVQQRARRSAVASGLANGAISALNSLSSCFSPFSFQPHNQPPSSVRLARNTSSTSSVTSVLARARSGAAVFPVSSSLSSAVPARIRRAVGHVKACADRFVSRVAPTFQSDSSDGISPSSPLPHSLLSSTFIQGQAPASSNLPPAALHYASETPSLPLCSERVSLPSVAGTANLLDILPPALAERYSRPSPELFASPDVDVPSSSSRHPLGLNQSAAFLVKSRRDYAALIRRMISRKNRHFHDFSQGSQWYFCCSQVR